MKKLFAILLLHSSFAFAQIGGFGSGVGGVPSTLSSQVLDSPSFIGTIAGTPAWASSQAITLSTAAQPNVTSLGTLTSIATSGTVSSVKACAAGFSRISPNFCRKTVQATNAWTNATACTARTSGGVLPAGATMAMIRLTWIARANNAVGARANNTFFSNDSGCSVTYATDAQTAWEYVATAAGTQTDVRVSIWIVPLVATDTFYTTQSNAGGNGNFSVNDHAVLGY